MTAGRLRRGSSVVLAALLLAVSSVASMQACGDSSAPATAAGAAGALAASAGRAGSALAGRSGGAGTSGHAGHSGQAGSAGGVSAGAGGAAPSGGQGGKDGTPSWTSDPTLWQEVPAFAFAAPACRLYEPRPGVEIPDVGWTWTSCGAGCEKAEVLRDGQPVRATLGGVQWQDGKEIAAIKWALYWKEEKRAIQFHSALEDGKPLLAWRSEGGCTDGNTNFYQPLYLVMRGPPRPDGTATQLPGYPDLALRKFFWAKPFEAGSSGLANGKLLIADGHPGTNVIPASALGLLRYAGSGKTEIIEKNPNLLDGGYGGDLAVFLDYTSNPAIVRGWADDGLGPRTLVDSLPGDSSIVGVGSKYIVGFLPTKKLPDERAAEGKLWWVPRTKTLSKVAPTFSAPLPNLPVYVSTGITNVGDFVVVDYFYQFDGTDPTYPKGVRHFLHIPTGKMWRYTYFVEGTVEMSDQLVFMTEEYFVVGRRLRAGDWDMSLRTLYRYRLSDIAQWAEPVLNYGP